jgi:hypothetical protein
MIVRTNFVLFLTFVVGFFSASAYIFNRFNIILTILSIIGTIIYNLNLYVFYLFAFLLSSILFLGFVSYKTKPNEESFQKNIDNIMKIIKAENNTKNLTEWFVFRLQMFKITSIMASYQYDCGIFRIGVVKDNDKRVIFVGTLDTWIPLPIR